VRRLADLAVLKRSDRVCGGGIAIGKQIVADFGADRQPNEGRR
jgi:hypothetical protein